MGRRAAITFLDAFLGSFATLLAGSHLLDVQVEGDILPSWRLLAQMIVSAIVAGAIALIGFIRAVLDEGGRASAQ